jgi:hypothetical protein
MSKTLVIVLNDTLSSGSTFDNFKTNMIDELNADLCLIIDDSHEISENDQFYNLAKFKFSYTKPNNLEAAFDYVHNFLSKDKPKYEKYDNTNALRPMIAHPRSEERGIVFYPDVDEDNINLNDYDEDEIVIHTKDVPDPTWKRITYGIQKSDHNNLNPEKHVITYKKSLYWQDFLVLKEGIFEGIREEYNNHQDLGRDSTGILFFLRWFVFKNLKDNDLINNYDRFIITKKNFIYELPHPKLEIMDENYIWIPDNEHYYGYPDRHIVLSKKNIEPYLNLLNELVLKSNEYFMRMFTSYRWDLEQLMHIHIQINDRLKQIKTFPHIMYSVKNRNGSIDVEFKDEYEVSNKIKEVCEKSKSNINDFYKNHFNSSFVKDTDRGNNTNGVRLTNKSYTYLTIKGRTDGFGAQYQAIMSGIAFCESEGFTYFHTPLNIKEHNVNKENLDEFIGIKNSSKKIPINMIRTQQCNEVHDNSRPSIYYTENVIKKIRDCYYSSSKPEVKCLDVALHIRRGDVNGSSPERFTAFDTILKYLPLLKKKYPSYKITVVSEGLIEDFKPLEPYCDDFFLNGEIRTAFHTLVKAKVLVMAKSSFSYTAAILNENIVYYESFWHSSLDHWHSVYNLSTESNDPTTE